MFQVIQPERALYIQANNCVEARDWIDILTKVSQCNRKRLSTYHPSAYLNGHWLCCKLSADAAPGCTPCTGYVTLSKSIRHQVLFPLFCPLSHSPVCICFQRPASKHPAGRRWRQRDWEDLFPVQHIHDQTDQDARSDTNKSVCEHACVWLHDILHVYLGWFSHCPFCPVACPPLQRRVAVSQCTTGPNRRSTPALSSMTPRRPTKPWNWLFQPCRPWSSSTPSTSATSSRRQR